MYALATSVQLFCSCWHWLSFSSGCFLLVLVLSLAFIVTFVRSDWGPAVSRVFRPADRRLAQVQPPLTQGRRGEGRPVISFLFILVTTKWRWGSGKRVLLMCFAMDHNCMFICCNYFVILFRFFFSALFSISRVSLPSFSLLSVHPFACALSSCLHVIIRWRGSATCCSGATVRPLRLTLWTPILSSTPTPSWWEFVDRCCTVLGVLARARVLVSLLFLLFKFFFASFSPSHYRAFYCLYVFSIFSHDLVSPLIGLHVPFFWHFSLPYDLSSYATRSKTPRTCFSPATRLLLPARACRCPETAK